MLTRRTTTSQGFLNFIGSADPRVDGPGVARNVDLNPPRSMMAQAYKDTSNDPRKNLSSFFAWGKRSAERDAYKQAHTTASGVAGVLNLGVIDPTTHQPVPFAGFEWNGRQYYTDAEGCIKFIEKDYFQTAISLENERVKFVSQMISLVAGQPTENVINLFGWEFYAALAGDTDPNGNQAQLAMNLYKSYLSMSGLDAKIQERKLYVFSRYADAECSPEVMCNFGENDPEWSRAFNKLALLIEYYPTSIITDQGTLNPLESSGVIHGDAGTNNAGDMPPELRNKVQQMNRRNIWDAEGANVNRMVENRARQMAAQAAAKPAAKPAAEPMQGVAVGAGQ